MLSCFNLVYARRGIQTIEQKRDIVAEIMNIVLISSTREGEFRQHLHDNPFGPGMSYLRFNLVYARRGIQTMRFARRLPNMAAGTEF